MFEKMKLRQRILLGYLAPLLLLAGAMSLVYVNMQAASRQAALTEQSYAISSDASDLEFAVIRMQNSVRGYLLQKNATSLQNYQDGEKDFRALSASLKMRMTDTQQQDTLKRIVELGDSLFLRQQQMFALVDQGKVTDAVAYYRLNKPYESALELNQLSEKFSTREDEITHERQNINREMDSRVISSIIYGMAAAIVIAVVIALWLAAAISRIITLNASQLSAAATEISATVTQHERTASVQAASANQTAASISELSASSRQSAEQAANMAASAEKSSAATAQGADATRQTVLEMNRLGEKFNILADHILQLGEQSGQIGSIATLLKDLSGQINMLSLNAAVEAARAGEQGKGFAVVASEIRKLADQSKKSAEQTAILVNDIQKATNSSILMTEEGTRTVTGVTQLVQKAAELFDTLSGMADSVNENSQQVMLNARQQAAAFAQVSEAAGSIAIGARETAQGISQTKIGVQKMNEAAENLKAIA